MQIAKTCSHRKIDGTTCRVLALSGRRYCHYHERYFDRNTTPRTKNTYALVPFEDTRSILFTINQLIYSFLNDQIEESKFTKTIYALQVAAQYANRDDALSPDAILEQQEQEKAEQESEQNTGDNQAGDKGNDDVCKMIDALIQGVETLQESAVEERAQALFRERSKTSPLPFQKT